MNALLPPGSPLLKLLGVYVVSSLVVGFTVGHFAEETPQRRAAHALTARPVLRPYALQTLCFDGPALAERSPVNPFLDVRLALDVAYPDGTARRHPGYFAADGRAADSRADSGDQYCVRLRISEPGDYSYTVDFQRGDSLALKPSAAAGEALPGHGAEAGFRIAVPAAAQPADTGVQPLGWLRYAGSRYPRFAEGGPYLKNGTNSPENFLAYAGFDGTYASDTSRDYVKTYDAHLRDWRPGDPTWADGQGKGIVGGLNYLASVGVNAIYFVTMNIGGDARDVWPYVDHETFDRFDVSKLEQWERVFRHADSLGLVLHVVTQETENETLLDAGDVGPARRLYYRELLARFGHHTGVIWNLGEENGRTPWADDPYQTDAQRRAMATWWSAHDPYDHPVVIHTLPNVDHKPWSLAPLLGHVPLDGLSFQVDSPNDVHAEVLRYLARADSAGHPWVIGVDEIGPYYNGVLADATDPAHDTIRREVIWGGLTAGAYGVEVYYGWRTTSTDLDAEDFRSREAAYRQASYAVEFLGESTAGVEALDALDDRVGDNAWALGNAELGEWYVYLRDGAATTLDLADRPGHSAYRLVWLNPRTGERTEAAELTPEAGGLELVPPGEGVDWAVWVRGV